MKLILPGDPSADKITSLRLFVQHNINRRLTNKVLHGHPSPLFWRRTGEETPMHGGKGVTTEASLAKKVNLYLSVPFCLKTNPSKCGYCLFPSEVYSGQHRIAEYLKAVSQEARMYRPYVQQMEPAAIYIGGGTPNLLRPGLYKPLMAPVRLMFESIDPGIEITLEGLPNLFTRDRLISMRAAGVNRVSMGVQQLDDKLIRLSGRKQTRMHVMQALDDAEALGFRTSVDLIFGWPQQNVQSMLDGLDVLVRRGVRHITHYALNVGGRSFFATKLRHDLPSIKETLQMYRLGRQFLLSSGYRQITPNDWEKQDGDHCGKFRFEENMRAFGKDTRHGHFTGTDMLGLGFGALSFFFGTVSAPGWVHMNHRHIRDYMDSIARSGYPVDRRFDYDLIDLKIGWIYQNLDNLGGDTKTYRALFGADVRDEFGPLWHVLQEQGWIRFEGERLFVVGDGGFFNPLMQSLAAADRQADLRRLGDGLKAQPIYSTCAN